MAYMMPRTRSTAHNRRFGPFPALLGWVVGTGLQLQQAQLWPASRYLAFAAAALILACFARWAGQWKAWRAHAGFYFRVMLTLLIWAALALALTGLRSVWYAEQALAPELEGVDLLVTGVIADLPHRSATGQRFRLRVESADNVGPLLDVGWHAFAKAASTVQAGERWRMVLRLKAPHGYSNPNGFDQELQMWEAGVQANASVRVGARYEAPQRLGQSGQYKLARWRQQVRSRIENRLGNSPVACVVVALVVGDQSAISSEDWALFRDTGVAHLISISGLHITMFAWAAMALLGKMWRRSARLCQAHPAHVAAMLGGVLLATAYALFSGWGLPAQRTCIMLATVALLRLLGLRWPWPQVWMLACGLVVAWDPWALLQAGFWLSFVAVAVLFCSDPARMNVGAPQGSENSEDGKDSEDSAQSATLRDVAQDRPWGWIRALVASGFGRILGLLREQWLLTLALAPLTILWFGQISVVGLVANLIAVPWVTLLVTPLVMAGVFWPAMWDLAAIAMTGAMGVLRWLAELPVSVLTMPALPWWLMLASLLGCGLTALKMPLAMRGLGIAFLLPVVLWRPVAPAFGQFSLLAADIGQGSAVLIRTASHSLLYDAGPALSAVTDAGARVLVPLMQSLQVDLDMLVVSHRDLDHAGGAASVLKVHRKARLLSSVEEGHALEQLRAVERCIAGQHWEWDGVLFEVLHPQNDDYVLGVNSNALSCVVRVQALQGAAVLLSGDIAHAQEARLVEAMAPSIRADLLVVPHHGSRHSSSDDFLDTVQPKIALIQAGYRNRYGHPQADAVQRYRERLVMVHDTPHCGAIFWHSEHASEATCSRVLHQRYWYHRVP